MSRISPCSIAYAKSIILLLIAALGALSVTVVAATIEVTPYQVIANANDHYDRNPSITSYGGEHWLFYTKGDYDSTQGIRMSVYNPDNDSYTIWYKRFGDLQSLLTAPETRLDLSATARPVGFDQRDVSAVVFQGNLYVFASAGFGGSQQPIYYYQWDGTTWTGPTALLTGGGGHANAVSDADRVYFSLEVGLGVTLQSLAFTWDGTTFSGTYIIANNNGVPKLTLKDGILYAVSIAPSGNTINLHTSPASAVPSTWTYVSDPITISDPGVYVWDPSICNNGTDLYVLAAPSTSTPDRQWIVQTRSVDNGATWSPFKTVSSGGSGDGTTWWDFWPIGWFEPTGNLTIFFATEGNDGYYLDGMIGAVSVDWNLGNSHSFYIQPAIDVATVGDTVRVGDGDYRGKGNRDLTFRGKGITLKSEHGPWGTAIHCGSISGGSHRGIGFFSGEDSTAVVDGIWIDSAFNIDAAVSCSTSSPTIKNCIIANNDCHGVFVQGASHPRLLGSTITFNTGRGVMVQAAYPLLSSVEIRNCHVTSNSGDGIWIEDSYATIDSTDVVANHGDGLHVDDFTISLSVTNMLSRGNTGKGIFISYWQGAFAVKNCTVVDNGDGFIYDFELPKGGDQMQYSPLWDSCYISRNLVAFNHDNGFTRYFADAPALRVDCNDSYGNANVDYSGTPFNAGDGYGNISLDPLFCDTLAHDYHIATSSPCAPTHNSCQTLMGKYGVACAPPYVCGDANNDGVVDISDAVYLISYIFSGGPVPNPLLSGDPNCDRTVDISDAVYLISYIFSGGAAPCADCPNGPTGVMLGMSQCKQPQPSRGASVLADLQRCVQWQYDGVGTLLLKHVNATFNCCPQIETQVTVNGNIIVIQEVEVSGMCYCMCTYDLDFQISNLPAGQYTISVIEPYATPPLQVTVDLVTTPTGEHCVASK